MEWKNININRQNIVRETCKAILFSMPNKSKYKGYVFWHPSKLVRNGRHSYSVSVGYNDEFTFKLKKYGQGQYNKKEIIDEKEINASEFEEVFKIMDENIVSKSR